MWIARLGEFLVAAGIYWWAALAVLLALERLAERWFHGFWKEWVDPWFTPARRKQALIIFALAALLIGTFRAWDAEREAKEQAIAERQKPLLDPTVLYQDGFPVASILEPHFDAATNTWAFQDAMTSRTLDLTKEFEYRTWKLLCSGTPTPLMSVGPLRQFSYHDFRCRIEALR
jgi:hypothetical protein